MRDVVDLVWETFRLRRLKTNLLIAKTHNGLSDILETFLPWEEASDLAKSWAARSDSQNCSHTNSRCARKINNTICEPARLDFEVQITDVWK